jgi:hypothetical protein
VKEDFMRWKSRLIESYIIGEQYFLGTIPWSYIGRLAQVKGQNLILKSCSRIGGEETDTFHEALKTGKFQNIEPFPPLISVAVPVTIIMTVFTVNFPLPTEWVINGEVQSHD